MDCCESPSPEWKAKEAQRLKDEEIMMNTEVSINGTTLKLKQMFPDCWAAKDFYSKLTLLNAAKGGKEMLDKSPANILVDEEEGEPA